MRRSDLRRAAALLSPALLPLLSAAAACWTYRAAEPALVPAGARVRVTLTPEGAAALAPSLGSSVAGVEGAWAGGEGSGSGDSVVVRVERLLTPSGVAIAWTGAPVGMPRGAIRTVERSTISGQRTALFTAGGVAVAALLGAMFRRGGKSSGGAGEGGPSPF